MKEVLIQEYNNTKILNIPFKSSQNTFNYNFVDGAFLEVSGSEEKEYLVLFIDQDQNKIVHSSTIRNNMWTKTNLKDLGWMDYNYHYDHMYKKHALVVLRDPVERWLSGICEYFALYHATTNVNDFNKTFYDLLMEQIVFDDHTEQQHYFIEGLSHNNITFFLCNKDYRIQFSSFLKNQGFENKYHKYLRIGRIV